MKFLDLIWQREQLEPEISQVIDDSFLSADFINGTPVRTFESAFANYVGAESCIACANGTDALELILEGMRIGEGDEVVVPAMTFVATSEAVFRVGATPILVDVAESAVLDFEQVVAALTPRTRAVVVVHLYGYPADVEELRERLDCVGRRDVLIIEDAAQAHGASRRGRMAGSMGHAAAFSFYPGKNLGAFGDAGAVTTSDSNLAERVRRLSNHGRLQKFDHEIVGRNSRMDSIQGAVLGVKLKYLEQWLARRREIASTYLDALTDLSWMSLPAVPDDGLHGWHQFAIVVPDRSTLRSYLEDVGVPTGIHYPQSLAEFSFHADSLAASFPQAVTLARGELSLPIGEHLSDADVDHVIGSLRAFQPSGQSIAKVQ